MTLLFSTRKTRVGTEHDAEAAVLGGLSELDHGLYKVTYVSPDGKTVYKLNRGSLNDGYDHGRTENLVAEAAWSAYGRKHGVPGIPPVSLYHVNGRPVLAMPYYPRHPDEVEGTFYARKQTPGAKRIRDAKTEWSHMGLEDLHDDNYRLDKNGKPFVIDMGGHARDYPSDELPDSVRDMCVETDLPVDDSEHDDDCGCGDCDDCYGDDDDDDDDYCGDCGDYCQPCVTSCVCKVPDVPDVPADPRGVVLHMTWGLGQSREFPVYAKSRDLCGLRTRLRQNTAGTMVGRVARPTCGHPSRHPSRLEVTPEREAPGQFGFDLNFVGYTPNFGNAAYELAIPFFMLAARQAVVTYEDPLDGLPPSTSVCPCEWCAKRRGEA